MRFKVFYCVILAMIFYIVPYAEAEGNDSLKAIGRKTRLHFILYKTSSVGITIIGDDCHRIDTSPWQNDFDPHKETKIITHGWTHDIQSPSIKPIKENYLRYRNHNVIAIDWSNFSHPNYIQSTFNIVPAATIIAKMIETLTANNGANSKMFHLIGHSLGAQLMGLAGGNSRSRVGRITGLDPAGPLYELADPKDRLDRGDADFVDVIHTCGYILGIARAIGHADFYPNQGVPIQPGCSLGDALSCSHARAYEFFAESISSEIGFKAFPCASWKKFKAGLCKSGAILMGDTASTNARVIFYLRTNSKPPFALA